LKSDHLNFEAEADFCRLIKNDPESKESKDKILQCIRISPDYFVLEHFGEDLRAYYQADLAVRTGPLLDAILSSVHFLHYRMKYIHGDLQPESFRIYDFRGRFFCKLCHFHNACQDGERFPTTVEGKLCITETWTCPELYWASRNKEPIQIDGSFQMDIFNLGLIIALLCHQDLAPDESVINPNSVTRDRLFLRENQDQFFQSILSLRHEHLLGDFLRPMLSFDPHQREDLERYQNLLSELSAQHLYQELCKEKEKSLEMQAIKAQLKEMSERLRDLSHVVEDNFSKMRGELKKHLATLQANLIQSSNAELKKQVDSMVKRLTIGNVSMGKSLFGRLEAMISSQMNLVSIENGKET
jgi:serine/threonine protein kinase